MLISVIIPTRERADYLKASLATCVAIPDPDIEIVVSDNASVDHTQEVIQGFKDPRIVYVNTGRRVSMRQNFDFAIGKSGGDYITIIGDDDAMLPMQFQSLRRVIAEARPRIFSWRAIGYGWPIPGYGRHGHVRLRRAGTFGPPVEIETAPLARALASGNTAISPIPRLYHGCVSRAVLEGMRARTGVYLNSRSPDTYFEYHALFSEKSFLFAEHPFSISGHSPASNGNAARYADTDPAAQPRLDFATENEADPRKDRLPDPWPSMSLAYFAILETVNHDLDPACRIPLNYRANYKAVLAADRHRPDAFAKVERFLRTYAETTGTGEDFRVARAAIDEAGRGLSGLQRALMRMKKNLFVDGHITVSGRRGGLNTVTTASWIVDRLLGNGYQEVLEGHSLRARLWRQTLMRTLTLRLPGSDV